MNKRITALCAVVLLLGATLVFGASGLSQSPPPSPLEQLRQDARGAVEITWNARTGTPSFLRGTLPLSGIRAQSEDEPSAPALAFVARYAHLFGVRDTAHELVAVQTDMDALGLRHVTFQQVYQGVEVYGAHMKIHLSAGNQAVVAASSGFVPGIALSEIQPRITAAGALTNAHRALPDGALVADPRLVVYAGQEAAGPSAHLAWLVELRDDALPARNLYVIDALKGNILAVLDRLTISRDRKTYDAGQGYTLPGTLARSEPDGPTGDEDVDHAHDFAGDFHDYYSNTHGRDSYDDQGATLISTANYGTSYLNAYWNGVQTVYGDDFPVQDVVAHEWTHAVTERTAALEYRWQSGALNESISDIFGAMVDRNDWLMGEDLPAAVLGGRDAIRDLADPSRLGQPGHTDDWVATCSDNEGVHTNSGIPNKAYYNIATAIGKDKAERIFYRALTVYLDASSSLEDARAAALQSALDMYGDPSPEYDGILDGFNSVGLDGAWEPPPNDCTCAATTALADETAYSDPMSALEVATTLYRVRDQLLTGEAGQHYRALYEQHTGRISHLLLEDAALRAAGGEILKEVTPGLGRLLDGAGDEDVVTQEVVDEVLAFLRQVAEEDRAHGEGKLADTVEREMARIEWDRLTGMTYADAWDYVQSRTSVYFLYLPIAVK
jgi:Zn-dependent metalloprotease